MILHIPHSSTFIPGALRDQFILPDPELQQELIRLTDAYTDELFDCARSTRVLFAYSRFLVDVERYPDDSQEPMHSVGMGRFYTRTTKGEPLRRPLTDEEIKALDGFYRKHHELLDLAVTNDLNSNHKTLIVDCHSFPSTPLPCDSDQAVPRPDFCVGTDSFHTPMKLRRYVCDYLEVQEFTYEINRPYSGTLIPLKYYQKDSRVNSIMIEVNRRLYMDEKTGQKEPSFDGIQSVIGGLLNELETLST